MWWAICTFNLICEHQLLNFKNTIVQINNNNVIISTCVKHNISSCHPTLQISGNIVENLGFVTGCTSHHNLDVLASIVRKLQHIFIIWWCNRIWSKSSTLQKLAVTAQSFFWSYVFNLHTHIQHLFFLSLGLCAIKYTYLMTLNFLATTRPIRICALFFFFTNLNQHNYVVCHHWPKTKHNEKYHQQEMKWTYGIYQNI